VQKRRYGDYIPISQIVKPKREERIALHMKKILKDEEEKREKTPPKKGDFSVMSPATNNTKSNNRYQT
jgi:hypothetical protein